MHRESQLLLVLVCILGLIAPINGQTSYTNEISIQVTSTKADGTLIENLLPENFEILVDGKKQSAISARRETRPLSMVVIVVTNPWNNCLDYDGSGLYELGLAFGKVLGSNDEVAIVVSDSEGKTMRDFSRPLDKFPVDFALARKIARENQTYGGTSDDYGNPEHYAGETYPMKALATAVNLLKNAPPENDRLIFFLSSLYNTEVGKAVEAREILNNIVSNKISISWLDNAAPERHFKLRNVPYGKRSFFLGLSSFTGGYFAECRQNTNFFNIFFGSEKQNSVEADLRALLERTRTRYRLKYAFTDKSKGLVPVQINLLSVKDKVNLDYPKATTHN